MTNDDYELPKLPPLEEVLRNARRSVSKRTEKLPLQELLRQLSEHVSAEDLKRLMERSEPSYVSEPSYTPESEPFPQIMTTNCPIRSERKGNGKISIVRDKFGENSISCEYFVRYCYSSNGRCSRDGPEKCPFVNN